MSPAILAYLTTGLQLIPMLIGAGQSVTTLVTSLRASLTGNTDPTPEQWAALDQAMADALAALDARARAAAPPAPQTS